MFLEHTTLASTTNLIADTLEVHYGIAPEPLLLQIGMNPELLHKPGARYPTSKMQQLWGLCVEKTGDSCFGLVTGSRIKTTTFHALGFAWLASNTVHEEIDRLMRYYQVICTMPIQFEFTEDGDDYRLTVGSPPEYPPFEDVTIDAFFTAILKLIRYTTGNHFAPSRIGLQKNNGERLSEYVEAFGCSVEMQCDSDFMCFDKELCDAELSGQNRDLAIANERVLENYVQALDPDKVSSKVRELLITLMPSGNATQDEVANKLHRSLSTLQRQLSAEGTNFKTIRDDTRRSMAEQYIQDGDYSLSQIAFLLGFSDQSNFSRAFKRWTGTTPGDYQPGVTVDQ